MVGHDIFSVLYAIIDQQIELYFGDDYPSMLKNAQVFVGVHDDLLMGWGVDKDELLNNEGGRAGLLRKALCHIIEEGDQGKGLRAYSKALVQEYTIAYARRRNEVSVENVPHRMLSNDGGIQAAFVAAESESENLTSSFDSSLDVGEGQRLPLADALGLDEDEYELAVMLGNNNNSLVDATQALGWDKQRASRTHGRLKDRYRRDRLVANPMSEKDVGRNGMHVRWHVNKGVISPDCRLCSA